MQGKNEGPAITNFVLENLPDYDKETGQGGYEILNAESVEKSDKKFVEQLVENLPELDEMKLVHPLRKGTVDLYEVSFDECSFYVKDTRLMPRHEYKFRIRKDEEYDRAKEYFSEYLPLTIFVKRWSEINQRDEYLILQEKLKGLQLKHWMEYPEMISTPNVSDNLKNRIAIILQRCADMYTETGIVFDLDFIMNPETDEIYVFDLDNAMQVTAFTWPTSLKKRADFLHEMLGIEVPPELYDMGPTSLF